MSEFNFTAARINALKPVEKDTWHKDTTKGKNATGLWLRQRKTELAKSSTLHKPKYIGGSLTWVFTGYINGRTRKITIGKWPAITVDEARKAAKNFTGQIANKIDPRAAISDEVAKRKKKEAKKLRNR